MINFKNKNILVLAPHTDDGELGLGGTINHIINEGGNVFYAAFTTAEESVPKEFKKNILRTEVIKATNKLGIKKDNLFIFSFKVRKLNYCRQEILEELIKIRNNINYDIIFLPSLNDIHQDHITIAQEGLRAFKNSTILGYELIWNNLTFNTQCFVKLKHSNVMAKVNALKMYKSQKFRKYMSKDFIFSLAKTRGVQIGCDYAESFEVIRLILI